MRLAKQGETRLKLGSGLVIDSVLVWSRVGWLESFGLATISLVCTIPWDMHCHPEAPFAVMICEELVHKNEKRTTEEAKIRNEGV